ncbi:MAG: hypothetical protein F4156_12845 [Holophagales bacterium]|nr:hypothetical protein [Holophagales bacterium]
MTRRTLVVVLLAVVTAAFVVCPATAQQLLRLGRQAPEDAAVVASAATTGGMVWGADVDLDLVRTGPETLEIPTPAGVLVEVVRTRFEDRGDGNALWIGRVAGTDHDHVQLTLQNGYLVGWYSEPYGRQFDLRARPDGSGRVVSPGTPAMPLCGVHDPHLRFLREQALEDMKWEAGQGPTPDAEIQASHVSGAKDLTALLLVTPDVVYGWERRQGSDTFAEVQALFDYANLVFGNNDVPVHVVPPAGTQGVKWAPLTLLNEERGHVADFGTLINRFDLHRVRSRYLADVVHLIYDRGIGGFCGRADGGIWSSFDGDSDGVPDRTESPANASLRAFEKTNLACGAEFSRHVFVHEIGHSLGAQHDRQTAPFCRSALADTGDEGGGNYQCTPEYAYSPKAYGAIVPDPDDPNGGPNRDGRNGRVGTVMSYAWPTSLPYFSSERRLNGRILTQQVDTDGDSLPDEWAANEQVLWDTAPLAADFELYFAPEPPSDLEVRAADPGRSSYLLTWSSGHSTDPDDLSVWWTQDAASADPSLNRTFNANWKLVANVSGGGIANVATTRVTVGHPGNSNRPIWFVVCTEHHHVPQGGMTQARVACSEPVADLSVGFTQRPPDLSLVPVLGRDDLVRVVWRDVNFEDGYKVQARAAGSSGWTGNHRSEHWTTPGVPVGDEISPLVHLVPRNDTQAYVWGLDDPVHFGGKDVEIRVCATRAFGPDECSGSVVKRASVVSLVAPYYAGEGGVIGVATGDVTVATTCNGRVASRVFPQAEWNNPGSTPGNDPRPAHAFNLRDYGLACSGAGELTVDGLGPGAWYYTRTDPPTAAPLFPASALTGAAAGIPTGVNTDVQPGGTWFRLGDQSPAWASTIIPHVETAGGDLVAPYYGGEGGVIGVATAAVTVTTNCNGQVTSRVFPQAEWNNPGRTPGNDPRPAHAFNLRDYELACSGAGELTVDGLGPGAWYYTRTDPPTAAPLFPASALTGAAAGIPTGVHTDVQPGGTWFRLGDQPPAWASTIIPHVD